MGLQLVAGQAQPRGLPRLDQLTQTLIQRGRLRALRLLVEQDKREQEEKQLPNRMSEWQKVQCKVVRNLTENEKVVYIDSANLQVRGGISNERVMRQAAARFVENLQKAPYNLSAAEAKKALKEVSPLNSRTIDKALSIQNDLNPDLRRLLEPSAKPISA